MWGAFGKVYLHLSSLVPPPDLLFHSRLSKKKTRLRKHSAGLGKGCTALQMRIRDWHVDTSEKDHKVLCAVVHFPTL